MAGLADTMKTITAKAVKEITNDSIKDSRRFIDEVIAPKMRSIAILGGSSMVIPRDLPCQNRVGDVWESQSVGTYLEYDFENDGDYTFILFRHLEKQLKEEGFSVVWNAVNTPYLSVSWA